MVRPMSCLVDTGGHTPTEGEDIGGGGGVRSPSNVEVGGTNRHRTTDTQVLEESKDDAKAQSHAPF